MQPTDNFTWTNLIALIAAGLSLAGTLISGGISIISLWRSNKNQRAIEALRAVEQRKTETLKIEFAQLYVDRANTIKKTYQKLCALEELIRKGESRTADERLHWYNEADESCKDFTRTWEEGKLFFNDNLSELVDTGLKELTAAMLKINRQLIQPSRAGEMTHEESMRLQETTDILIRRFPEIKREIKREFRLLLGPIEHDTHK